jgi:hypothetical protein
MKKLGFLISLIIIGVLFSACHNNGPTTADKSADKDSNTMSSKVQGKGSGLEESEVLKIKAVATSFHDWYIYARKNRSGIDDMRVLEGENGKCKVDTLSYFTELRKIGTISERFIEQEKLRFKDCIEYIETRDYSEYLNSEMDAYWDQCPFFYYMYWGGGHEIWDGVSAESYSKDHDVWYVSLHYLWEPSINLDGYISEAEEFVVKIEKENGSYMITEIKRVD